MKNETLIYIKCQSGELYLFSQGGIITLELRLFSRIFTNWLIIIYIKKQILLIKNLIFSFRFFEKVIFQSIWIGHKCDCNNSENAWSLYFEASGLSSFHDRLSGCHIPVSFICSAI